jgi:hypothetical protein
MTKVQGFAEVEYGMLRYMGAIDDSTLVVTSGNFGSCFCNFVLAIPSKDFQR